jgi:hypothetical protein
MLIYQYANIIAGIRARNICSMDIYSLWCVEQHLKD